MAGELKKAIRHFFVFFPSVVTQSRKNQLLTLTNPDLSRQEFFFLLWYFLRKQKMGLLTLLRVAFTSFRLAAGFALASNPALSAIFFALISRQKNMKPEKALLHTASAVLHILRQCRKMLHTPTGVLHKNEAFSDEATSL